MKTGLNVLPLVLLLYSLITASELAAAHRSEFIDGPPAGTEEDDMYHGGWEQTVDPETKITKHTITGTIDGQVANFTNPFSGEVQDRIPTKSFVKIVYFSNTGSDYIDLLLKAESEEFFVKAMLGAIQDQPLMFNDVIPHYEYKRKTEIMETYLYKPTDSIISLLITSGVSTSGYYAQWDLGVVNFDLLTNQKLTNKALFLNPEKSIHPYWEYVQKEGREKDGNAIFPICKSAGEMIAAQDFMLDNMVLSPKGATLVYGPYLTCRAMTHRNYVLDIPKEKMIELGANPDIWK